MALMRTSYHWLKRAFVLLLLALLPLGSLLAQSANQFDVRNGSMYIELVKASTDKQLLTFIRMFQLEDLDLLNFVRAGKTDSIRRKGWMVEQNDNRVAVLRKPLLAADKIYDPSERMKLTSAADRPTPRRYGVNRFRNKRPFAVQDSIVYFFLRAQTGAGRVQLAGSFTNWENGALGMKRTDSGWIAAVKLPPGKYWYKFIVDGEWQADNDNLQNENDGQGNINSVFFVVNRVFHLAGYDAAREVWLSGSFNDWREKELRFQRGTDGWYLPVYLADGTHSYKFIADGKWIADPGNNKTLSDGHGGTNSVLRMGNGHRFALEGFTNARRVTLAGSFNGWNRNQLELARTATGWELTYALGPGLYEYKFVVDGRYVADPANSLNTDGKRGNSILVLGANYTFRLPAKGDTKSVYVAGDFNGWNPRSLPMRREGSEWVFPLHLSAGKHRYKFIVDGKWILDPGNKLWENNEFGTGNSIVWIP
ncbi:MAG: hypothetical protein EOO08_14020 [Chitinophagaceae bacterium]|nr:MAG: hypothetical protein EOO08_14020 [Chitinophagaceae bacterium]